MAIPEDLVTITHQEAELRLPRFDHDTAWRLGLSLRELAVARNQSIVIDIRRFGQPHQPLFYTALSGTTPDNPRWVQRKSNVVARFHRSSYAIGLMLAQDNRTFAERYSLPDADYAAHGGSFPSTSMAPESSAASRSPDFRSAKTTTSSSKPFASNSTATTPPSAFPDQAPPARSCRTRSIVSR
jgi:uncharacterized protein (UPF0303 family)